MYEVCETIYTLTESTCIKTTCSKMTCIKKTSNHRKSVCNKGFTLCSAADNVCIVTMFVL